MDKSSLDLISFLRTNQPTMIAQLHEFCEINSFTYHLSGLAKMHDALQKAYSTIADSIESVQLPQISRIDMSGQTITEPCGNALYIRKRPSLKRRVLLCGHMDTVYPAHHSFQQLTYIDKNHINGPGVADMKGGLIVMLHALIAFEATAFAKDLGWDVFINTDEEIGSPASSPFLAKHASQYEAALVYEPTMTIDGTLAKNRKGSGKLTLIAKGKSAHAGRAFHEGRNAICYLAEAISAIHALNNQREGVTINVGMIAGGEALNVIPDQAVAKLDIRISHPDDQTWVQENIQHIISKLTRQGYSLTVHGDFSRPVKRVNGATEHLFHRIQHVAQKLGLTVDWQDSGGCCDGNNLAQKGLAVIDTLGVRGGEIHSTNEFIVLDSLVDRSALSTLLLIDLAKNNEA